MSNPGRRSPTQSELEAGVVKQIGFIQKSATAVMAGDSDEAVRVAVSLRVLLHDTKSSHSLLGQVGWKDNVQYLSSLRRLELAPGITMSLITDDDHELGVKYGLVALQANAAGPLRYVPPFDEGPASQMQSFTSWWKDKVLWNDAGAVFSRWDLVDAMAHQDGGAHVDPRGVPVDYADFKLKGAGNLYVDLPPGTTELPTNMETLHQVGDAASPTVAQIGWELIESLIRSGKIQTA